MKKTIVFALFVCMMCGTAFAQNFSKGIEAAVTTSTIKIGDIDNATVHSIKGDAVMGYEAGLWFNIKMGPIYAKPKVLLHYERGELAYTVNETEKTTTFSAGKVLVPVLVGIKFIPPVLSLEGGPVLNYVVFATKDFEDNKVDIAKAGIGYRIGLNAEFSVINLTVSYQGIKNNASSGLASFNTPNTMVFGIGVKF